MLHIFYFGDPEFFRKVACLSNDTPTQVALDMLKGQAALLATTVTRFAVKMELKKTWTHIKKDFIFFNEQ